MKINTKTNEILKILYKLYPHAKIKLNFNNNWELLVSVILSAQCTDKMVNKVTTTLFKKYKSLDDYTKANTNNLQKDIKSVGFYKQKALRIIESSKIIKERFHGKVPRTMEDLLTLPGVARKTANVVLENAFNLSVGIAVDTHVRRISQRLRLIDLDKIGGRKRGTFNRNGKKILDFIKDANPEKIESLLMNNIPKKNWSTLTYLLIEHGRQICKSQSPKCGVCLLSNFCLSSRI